MKWFTHQVVALGVAASLGFPFPEFPAVLFGAVLPDVLDQRAAALFRNRRKAFNRIHRGPTHWFGWWLGLALLGTGNILPPPAQAVPAGLGFGGLMHVGLDLCTTAGVPLLPWTRRGKVSMGFAVPGGRASMCC